MKKTFIPEEFREKYTNLFGEESSEFFNCCKIKIPKSIWVNSLKIKPDKLKNILETKGWKLTELFHENAFAIEGIEKPGQEEEFRQGLFNLQEKSSMIPVVALSPEKNDFVLDAAAAPGNKTLQISCLMEGKGQIVAVDKNVKRFTSMKLNFKKFGVKNIIEKRMDLLDSKKNELFDKVLLDAPCSSEGLVRKDFDALKNWSQELVEKKAELQKKMIETAFRLLKRKGTMVYSTCSLSPEEDEEVIKHILENQKAEIEEIKIKGFKIRKGIDGIGNRIMPQDNNSQAFYFCKVKKL